MNFVKKLQTKLLSEGSIATQRRNPGFYTCTKWEIKINVHEPFSQNERTLTLIKHMNTDLLIRIPTDPVSVTTETPKNFESLLLEVENGP